MPEEIKERLSKTEYDKVGEMLLELIAECPFIPADLKDDSYGILYDSTSDGKGIFILTDGGKVIKRNVLGGFTAAINMQIAYQSAIKTNPQRINAQETVNQITGWLGDLENLPKLTKGRTITKFEASGSYASRDDTTPDGYVVYASNISMEYKR